MEKLKSGMLAREVAASFGVSVPTVYNVKAMAAKRATNSRSTASDSNDDDGRAESRESDAAMDAFDLDQDDHDDEPPQTSRRNAQSTPVRVVADRPMTPTELEMLKNRVEILVKSARLLSYSQILAGCHLSPGQFAAVLKVAVIEKNENGLYQIKSRIKA